MLTMRRKSVRTLAAVVTLACAGGASASHYTVRKGDTLSAIATKHRTSVAALMQANHIKDPDRVLVGQTLLIKPKSASTLPMQLISSVRTPAVPTYYVVRRGDTVSSVAAAFGRSSEALAAANGIINGQLYYGARLRVDVSPAGQPPVPARPFIAQPTATVPSTMTVAKMARRLKVSATSLATINGLSTGTQLGAGSSVVVPDQWICPVRGRVSFMNDWGFIREGGSWHHGSDLMAARGTPVVAPVKGVVERFPNPKGGNAFFLRGADGHTYYGAHLDRYAATGKVKAGTVIGYVGDTGDAKGGPMHLHFEIRPKGGEQVNPYPTINIACR